MTALTTIMPAKRQKKTPSDTHNADGTFKKGHKPFNPSPSGPRGKQKNPNPACKANLKPAPYSQGFVKLDKDMLEAIREIANPNNETPAQLFAGALRRGLPIHLACERAGIARSTWKAWVDRAEKGDEKNPMLQEFLFLARQIQAEHYAFHMDNIRQQATGERKGWWQASAWVLERCEQDQFALRKSETNNISIDIKSITDAAAKAAIEYEQVKVKPPLINVVPLPEEPQESTDIEAE